MANISYIDSIADRDRPAIYGELDRDGWFQILKSKRKTVRDGAQVYKFAHQIWAKWVYHAHLMPSLIVRKVDVNGQIVEKELEMGHAKKGPDGQVYFVLNNTLMSASVLQFDAAEKLSDDRKEGIKLFHQLIFENIDHRALVSAKVHRPKKSKIKKQVITVPPKQAAAPALVSLELFLELADHSVFHLAYLMKNARYSNYNPNRSGRSMPISFAGGSVR